MADADEPAGHSKRAAKAARADAAAEGSDESAAEAPAADEAAETASTAKDADSAANGGKREFLLASAGIEPYWRGAALSANGKALPPCFCVRPANSSPLLTRIALRGEFYPLSIGGHGAWFEGLGVHLEGGIGIPRTGTDLNPVTAVSNTIAGGAQYRLVLGDTLTAPELKFKLGYSAYVFNLKNLVFPSVGFRAPYLAVAGVVPLGTEYAAIVAEVRGMAPVTALAANAALGSNPTAAPGFHGEVGFRFRVLSAMEINALAFLDNYSAAYTGTTALPHTTTQYQNVTVTDRSFGALIGVGFYL